jgi:general secretion pathway protein G
MKNHSITLHRSLIRRGFTLMEMILVLAIISVLVGLGVFAMTNVLGDAEIGKAAADLKTLDTNLIRFKTMAGRFPTQGEGLEAFYTRPSTNVRNWRKLMDEKGIYDPWGEKYQYRTPAKKNIEGGYDLFSKGQDKQEGTEDDVNGWE